MWQVASTVRHKYTIFLLVSNASNSLIAFTQTFAPMEIENFLYDVGNGKKGGAVPKLC